MPGPDLNGMSVTVSGWEEPSEELAGRQSQPPGQRVARGPVLQEPCPQYVQWVSSSEGSGTILCIYLFVLKHMLTYPGEALFPPEGSDISEGTNALPRAHTAQGDVQHSAPCRVPASRTTSLPRRAVTLSLMRA